jgi:hypothetical protein
VTIWQTVANDVSAGHILPDGRVMFASSEAEAEAARIYDPTDASITVVRPGIRGPYVIDAERTLFVTSETGETGEVLVGGEVPPR